MCWAIKSGSSFSIGVRANLSFGLWNIVKHVPRLWLSSRSFLKAEIIGNGLVPRSSGLTVFVDRLSLRVVRESRSFVAASKIWSRSVKILSILRPVRIKDSDRVVPSLLEPLWCTHLIIVGLLP